MQNNNRYRREFAEVAAILIRHGLPEAEIIRLLAVNNQQFERWKKSHPELTAALQQPSAADRAENALLKRALGFQLSETSAEELIDKKSGEILEVLKRRTITKDVPPDVRALLFYLQNRFPERWDRTHAVNSCQLEIPEEDQDL